MSTRLDLLPLGFVLLACGTSDATPGPRPLTEAEERALLALALPIELPPARGNAYADDLAAARLGFQVFFDARFSRNGAVSCESCHSPGRGFNDRTRRSVNGLGPGRRNSPTLLNAARYDVWLWDGRADSLWSQPLLALENPDEMDFSRLEIVHTLRRLYAPEYQEVFGPLPDFSDSARFPAAGAPGDTTWEGMTEADRDGVNRAVANLGKALEAYVRKLATGESPVDRYLRGDTGVLTEAAARGLRVFARAGCLDCHNGPALSDGLFHNLGVPEDDGGADPGSTAAALPLAESPFNYTGPYADTPPPAVSPPRVLGGFRTPSLRNLRRSPPYGHNGAFATLEEVVDFHLEGGGGLVPQSLTPEERSDLIELLEALDGVYPPLPWSDWPNGTG